MTRNKCTHLIFVIRIVSNYNLLTLCFSHLKFSNLFCCMDQYYLLYLFLGVQLYTTSQSLSTESLISRKICDFKNQNDGNNSKVRKTFKKKLKSTQHRYTQYR